ncbi:PAS domain-containing protein [Ulvibacterium marinum]|uniref:PAS domain-containing protein n=1 Tax=Ulvibacterium marinum TaxID=2419782 RepID=A0A3B0CB13_9FLAO|nr:PAS domain-containing protein [Ulvibacterium marinum]RKN82993.1 PAS domain-containing protein [Ulvibacterium marinum]
MDEIKNYDTAAHKFYNSQIISSLPLISWDFHATHFQKVCKDHADVFQLKKLAQTNKWSTLLELDDKLIRQDYVIVVTDSHLKIVHATQNILEMNGYMPKEIIGKKPKMFQGKDTCTQTSEEIGRAVRQRKPFEAVVLNYRKNGSSYKCWIKGEPIYDIYGEVVNFIAYEKEVA